MKLIFFVALIFVSSLVGKAEPISKVVLPIEVTQELNVTEIPDAIKGKVWNRWTSDNFVVLSLNDVHAQYLHKHLELVKVWALSRWGLYDVSFSAECKIIAVDDPDLFRQMFAIDGTRVEVRRNTTDKIEQSVLFILVDKAPSHTVPAPLTEVCLAEFSQKYNIQLNWWAYRGIGCLNSSLDQIRDQLHKMVPIVESNQPIYFSEGLMSMTSEKYKSISKERQELYDACAVMFCLLVRKEFGQDKFQWILKRTSEGDAENALKEVLGFEGFADFDRTYKRYVIDLIMDIRDGKTPDTYLQIRESTSSSSSAFSSS